MRSAFDSEDPSLRVRRVATIRKIRVVVGRLIGALRRGYIWQFEDVRSSGLYLRHMDIVESVESRASRLKQIIGALIRLMRQLESAPIPSAWLATQVTGSQGSLPATSARDQALADVLMFYSHRARESGVDLNRVYNNVAYIMNAPGRSSAIRPALLRRGISTGIYIQVPDPVNEPMVYRRLTGFEGMSGSGVILDVMHDSFGYYYFYRGEKHYLPQRP